MSLVVAQSLIWTSLDTWIVITGVLSATACAVVGSFLVLRRMSMMGDAISHAVLPGLAVSFLLTGSRDSVTMFVGAAVVGVLTALFTESLHRIGRVEQGAAMGVVFTVLFALGLILIVRAADAVDLDPGCVLYGSIELVPLDTRIVLGLEVPRAVLSLSIVLLIDLVFVVVFYKELKITAFDPALATTLGISARLMHYALMTLVAVTTVAAFESVGSILVIAMLIVPAAAARLLTDRLDVTLVLAIVLAAASAAIGHLGAITVPVWFGYPDTSTAGMMAVVVGLFLFVAVLAGPRYGLISSALRRYRLALRIAAEDVLGLLYRLEEAKLRIDAGAVRAVLDDLLEIGPLTRRAAFARLQREGKLIHRDERWLLTDAGRSDARQLVRSHRLWEAFLARHWNVPADHLHAPADRIEHFLPASAGQDIARELDDVEHDPHGRDIPHRRD
jgi:manganese/zinc/iron transport system permease protein